MRGKRLRIISNRDAKFKTQDYSQTEPFVMKKPLRVREDYKQAIEKWVQNIDNNMRMKSNEMHEI